VLPRFFFREIFVHAGRNLMSVRGRFLLLLIFCWSMACSPAEAPYPRQSDSFGSPRVVSYAASLTEIIFDIGCESRLVGTDDFSNYPAEAAALPKLGGTTPNVELIAAVRPDLVLFSSSAAVPAVQRQLELLGIATRSIPTDRLDQVLPTVRTVGRLLDCPVTEHVVQRLESSLLSQRRERRRSPSVLLVIWPDPLFVAGRDSFGDDLIEWAGGRNAVEASGWPEYSLESVLARQPDILLFAIRSTDRDVLAGLLRSRAGWSRLGAFERGDFHLVDEDLFSRPGPRVVEAAARLNEILDSWEARGKP
jgi:iron complex transport system substrate-binding protein